MKITSSSRLHIRIQNVLFTMLFLSMVGLCGWIATRYNVPMDWTASGRNTLSEASKQLLDSLQARVHVTVFAREEELLRRHISQLLGRYRRHKPGLEFEFVNPDTVPDRVRELGISVDGEMLIEYEGRSEHLKTVSEQTLTNALQRVARAGDRWLAYLTGHGERRLLGEANHDLGDWGKQLEARGFNIQALNLAQTGTVPDNTTVLVIAGPKVDLLPGEIELINGYVDDGGNLLWLHDPGQANDLESLAELLGVEFVSGTIIDPTTQLYGIDNPSFILVTNYAHHAVTRAFDLLTLFPQAAGIRTADPIGSWTKASLLTTGNQGWSETGKLQGTVQFDEDADVKGAFDIAIALTRSIEHQGEYPTFTPGTGESDDAAPRQQRIVVVGDGDFLSNSYLGNGGNLDLGSNMINWLSADDSLIAIPSKTAPDLGLSLSQTSIAIIGLGSLLGLPVLLLATGFTIWIRRRRL